MIGMIYCKVTACVLVEDKNNTEVTERFQQAIDQLVRDRIPVFISDVVAEPNCDVQGTEQ